MSEQLSFATRGRDRLFHQTQHAKHYPRRLILPIIDNHFNFVMVKRPGEAGCGFATTPHPLHTSAEQALTNFLARLRVRAYRTEPLGGRLLFGSPQTDQFKLQLVPQLVHQAYIPGALPRNFRIVTDYRQAIDRLPAGNLVRHINEIVAERLANRLQLQLHSLIEG